MVQYFSQVSTEAATPHHALPPTLIPHSFADLAIVLGLILGIANFLTLYIIIPAVLVAGYVSSGRLFYSEFPLI